MVTDPLTLAVFILVYAGMMTGGFRGLAIDRTGIVLLGAIVLLAAGRVGAEEAWAAVHVPTMALLFGLMILSAQFRLGGFYSFVTRSLDRAHVPAPRFLLLSMATAAVLSSLLANDIICLAMTPLLIEICARRRLQPLPFLLGLSCSSNIGSAATLIGNPQNMLIGQVMELNFARYALLAAVPSVAGLLIAWGIIAWLFRGRWTGEGRELDVEAPELDKWQSGKGFVVLAILIAFFLGGWVPREVAALAAAGVLLLSRRLASPKFLSLVDWNLLVLFIGLFIVNHTMAASGMLEAGVGKLRGAGIDLEQGGVLFAGSAVLSNLVSNVPAVMLLLPSASGEVDGLILALASTFAGNFVLVGSIANIIVAEQAARLGVSFSTREHARAGVPVTLATLAVAAAWVWLLRAPPP